MSNEPRAFTITGDEFSAVPRPRRRVPALLMFLVVLAMLVGAYDLLLLALGI